MRKQLIQMPTKVDPRLSFLYPNILFIISGVFLGALCTFYLGPYLNLVEQLGTSIFVQDDMIKDYITSLVWATFFGTCIILSPIRHKDKNMLLLAWFIKCFVSLFVLLFYEAHYPSDALGYFVRYSSVGKGVIGEFTRLEVVDTQNFTSQSNIGLIVAGYNKIVLDIIMNSYHSLKISFSMVGLMATYLLYRTSILITKKENQMFFWVLLLFPSLLIWTSRIGKEPLMAFGVAVYAAGLVNWHFKRKTVYLFVGFIGLLICMFIRIWVGSLFLLPLFFYFLYANKNFLSKTASVLLMSILMLLALKMVLNRYDIKGFNDPIDGVYSKLERVTNQGNWGGSARKRAPLVINGPLDIIKYAPAGVFTSLFRPLPWDVSGLLGLLSGMEGLLLLYLFFRAVIRTRLRELNDPILVWAIVLVFSWAVLYGMAIQNFGTGIRWKAQVLPIFLSLLIYLGRRRQKTF